MYLTVKKEGPAIMPGLLYSIHRDIFLIIYYNGKNKNTWMEFLLYKF